MMSLKEMKQILTHYIDQKLLKTLSDKEIKDVFDMVSDTIHFYPVTLYEGRPTVERVIFNNPATIVFFSDGTKSVVKCQKGDKYSKEAGLSLAIAKRMLGNKEFHKTFEKFIENSDDASLNDLPGKTSIVEDTSYDDAASEMLKSMMKQQAQKEKKRKRKYKIVPDPMYAKSLKQKDEVKKSIEMISKKIEESQVKRQRKNTKNTTIDEKIKKGKKPTVAEVLSDFKDL